MATEQAIWRETFEAAEDLSSDQYKVMVLDSNAKARRPDAEDEVAINWAIISDTSETLSRLQRIVSG